MNSLEILGVFLLGSLFNVFIITMATSIIVKQLGGQVRGIIQSGQKIIEGVKGLGQ